MEPGGLWGYLVRAELTCVYATDRGFLPITCFSARSLVARASIPLDVVILTAGLHAADLRAAETYLSDLPVRFVPIPVDAFDGLPRPPHLPLVTYGRLLLDRLLPGDHDRVVYIDGDTLIDIDIAGLKATPLDGATVGAVLDFGRVLVGRDGEARTRLELGSRGDYFNAGVLLIDWAAWRRKRIGPATLEALRTEPSRFTQRDQCALNYICRGDWQKLDVVWNYQPINMLYDDREQALVHFLGGRKPWQPGHTRHAARYINRYADLFAASPWASADPRPLNGLSGRLRPLHGILSPKYWLKRPAYQRTMSRYLAALQGQLQHREPAIG